MREPLGLPTARADARALAVFAAPLNAWTPIVGT
jgi:hypothetical protein